MAVIACVGDNCVDRYVGADGSTSDLAGGNALNVAVHVRGAYYGAVGRDPEGAFVLAEAEAAGADVENVVVLPGRTGVTVVSLSASGERSFVSEEYGASGDYLLTPETVHALASSAWVHAARQPDLAPVAAAVRREGTRISYDFCDSWDDALVDELAPQLEVAFFSGDADAARRAHDAGVRIAIATHGADGCLAVTERGETHCPAAPTEVIDTLGAGDALIAAFIAAQLVNHSVDDSLAAGANAAARACAHAGAWPTVRTEQAWA